MTDWFKKWFDTEYYHILYKNRNEDEAQKFVLNLVSELSLNQSSRVVDLCCGKGRHAKHLNELGCEVLGLDLSVESIKSAKKYENDRLKFRTHDMRDGLVNEQFDAVLNLFTSFGYFENKEDNLKVLESIKTYLRPNGILIIDFVNFEKVQKLLPLTENKKIDGINFLIKKVEKNGIISKTIQFENKGVAHEYEERVQFLNLSDFRNLLELSGYDLVNVFGDYSLSIFDPQNSSRLIIKARLK